MKTRTGKHPSSGTITRSRRVSAPRTSVTRPRVAPHPVAPAPEHTVPVPLRVVLLDDNRLGADLLTKVLEGHPEFKVVAPRNPDSQLTKREWEIADLIAEGLMNKEIASRLDIATQTVKTHVHHILDKLALHTRVQIAVQALRPRSVAREQDESPSLVA